MKILTNTMHFSMDCVHQYAKVAKPIFKLLLICGMGLWSHMLSAQLACLTPNDPDIMQLYEDIDGMTFTGPVYVKIYVHVVQTGLATGGLTLEEVEQSLDLMRNTLRQSGIYFIWDCNVDYINNDAHYTDINGNESIFSINPHADGVDIYFYPKLPSVIEDGGGVAQDIGDGTAMYLAGNYRFGPVVPLYTTRIVAHEMGHCLGLVHTDYGTGPGPIGSCAEHVPRLGINANCNTCGDMHCDTPADPGMGHNVNPATCVWNGSGVDENGVAFDPDEKNIMGYTNVACMEYFSAWQVQTMLNVIETDDVVKQVKYSFDFDIHEINTNTVWTVSNLPNNGLVSVGDAIIVKAGRHLTISPGVIVRFAETAKLIVEPGGRLTLNGTLTSFCGSSWKGVEIWGNSDQTQYFSGGQYFQGQVYTSNTAIIENAAIALYVSGLDVVNDAGGMVFCDGSLFRNNGYAAYFHPYQNSYLGHPRDNVSFFRDCTFEVDDLYPGLKPFKSFAFLSGVEGIKFESCTFRNEMLKSKSNWRDYGDGISAIDASFHVNRPCKPDVSPCSEQDETIFERLAHGIYVRGVLGNKPFTVKNARFTECYLGIRQSQVSSATILVNQFELGTVPNASLMNEQFGVFIEGATVGMDLQENSFIASSGNADETFGIYAQHLGPFDNVIRRNTFSAVDFANSSEGMNRTDIGGLYYECNYNVLGTGFDFSVMDDPAFQGPEGVRPIQGITDNGSGQAISGAGNTFNYTPVLQQSDFFNDANEDLDYLYYSLGTNEQPQNYSSSVVDLISTGRNFCIPKYCIEICQTAGELDALTSDYSSTYSAYANLLPSLYGPGGIINSQVQARLTSMKARMDDIVRLQVQHILYDTIDRDYDNLRLWLDRSLLYAGEVLLANSYATARSWSNALNHLATLPSAYNLTGASLAEHNRYVSIITLLQSADSEARSMDLLTSSEQQSLASIHDQSYSFAKRTAANILSLYDSTTILTFQTPGSGVQERSLNKYTKDVATSIVSVKPNPSIDVIYIEWENLPTDRSEFVLLDIHGRLIKAIHLSGSNGMVQMDLSLTAKGIYVYEVRNANSRVQNGKIIIQ